MSWVQNHPSFDLIWVLVWGAGLGFLHWTLFWFVEILPFSDDRRASLGRLRPLIGAGLALLFALFSAHALFARYPEILPIALLLVLVAFFVGSRALVRDFFAGVALRAERSFQLGDHIRIGNTRGRVTELGARAIVIATPEGDSALVPYSQAAEQPIVRTRAFDQSASRTFTLKAPEPASFSEVSRQVRRAALLHHWGSIAKPPEITSKSDGTIEVTVFALAQDHANDVERAVRKAVERTPLERRR
jgi:small-conductance mechanosensitive channel